MLPERISPVFRYPLPETEVPLQMVHRLHLDLIALSASFLALLAASVAPRALPSWLESRLCVAL